MASPQVALVREQVALARAQVALAKAQVALAQARAVVSVLAAWVEVAQERPQVASLLSPHRLGAQLLPRRAEPVPMAEQVRV